MEKECLIPYSDNADGNAANFLQSELVTTKSNSKHSNERLEMLALYFAARNRLVNERKYETDEQAQQTINEHTQLIADSSSSINVPLYFSQACATVTVSKGGAYGENNQIIRRKLKKLYQEIAAGKYTKT